MKTMTAKGTTFCPVSTATMPESEFEKIVLNSLDVWLAEFHCFKFKGAIVSEDYGTKKPDILLIDREYRQWLIVEVEMARHSLHSHVIPQIKVFKDATYRPAFADLIRNYAPFLSLNELKQMLRGDPPEVVVIADENINEWGKCIRRENCHYVSVEVLKSIKDEYSLIYHGKFPTLKSEEISTLITDSHIPRIARLTNPGAILTNNEYVDIFIDGAVTKWSAANDGDKAWISCNISPALKPGSAYKIFRNHQNRFEINTEEN